MGSPMTLSDLTLSNLQRSKSRSLRLLSTIFCKGAELGHMLLLNMNSKLHIESPTASLDLHANADLLFLLFLLLWRFRP